MKPIRTLIVDDERLARVRIRNLLRGHADFEVIDECVNGQQAVTSIGQMQPDLVFLDVQMPDLNGFDVLAAIRPERWPIIVFVTAYDQYALKAFDVHALDYLLKPFDDERFEQALAWARTQFQQQKLDELSQHMLALLDDHQRGRTHADTPPPSPQPKYLTRLMLKSAGRVFFINTADIDWIKAEGYYSSLCVGSQSHLLRKTMTALEAELDPNRFVRIHRSTIINLDRLKELRACSHGEYLVILRDGTQLKLSRSHRNRLQMLLEQRD